MASTIKTKIKLRCDSYQNWERSLSPLYEGEVGIGYDTYHNPVTGVDEKRNFKIKVGRQYNGKEWSFWRDSADLIAAGLDPDSLQVIAQAVIDQLGDDTFVKTSVFNQFKVELEQTISQMQTRLSNRVKACVSDKTLLLSTDD